jgi:hypothetical protein
MMVGTIPIPENFCHSMGDLANSLTSQEQLDRTQVTALSMDTKTGSQGNLVTFEAQPNQLGRLVICASGAGNEGTKIISAATIYINGTQTKVDVYRLPKT